VEQQLVSKRQGKFSKGILFLQDNAAPDKTAMTHQKLAHLGLEVLQQPACSPDFVPSERHLFPNLKKHVKGGKICYIPTFVDKRGVAWSTQQVPTAVTHGFLDWNHYSSLKQLLNYPSETEWTTFRTNYFPENLVATRIEHGTSGSVATNSDNQITEAV
jgi:hypothetical protein